jgi:hypothetical protein
MRRKLDWISGLKLKTALWLVAISLATFISIALAGLPAVPMISVAVAAAAVSVSKLTLRLSHPTCLSCGHDLTNQPVSAQGIACPGCGAVRSPGLVEIARLRAPEPGPDDDSTIA